MMKPVTKSVVPGSSYLSVSSLCFNLKQFLFLLVKTIILFIVILIYMMFLKFIECHNSNGLVLVCGSAQFSLIIRLNATDPN